MKKIIIYILQFSFILFSCNVKKDFTEDNLYSAVDFDNIESMKIVIDYNKGKYYDLVIDEKMKEDFKKLNLVKGPWKFMKKIIIINYLNKTKDTISTNGKLFIFKGKYYLKEDNTRVIPEELFK